MSYTNYTIEHKNGRHVLQADGHGMYVCNDEGLDRFPYRDEAEQRMREVWDGEREMYDEHNKRLLLPDLAIRIMAADCTPLREVGPYTIDKFTEETD